MKDEMLDLIGENADRRRVIIIDFNHLAWRYAFSNAKGLSINRLVNGVSTIIDTTVPSYAIKQIVRWSNFGVNPTIVCLDAPVKSRKAYFSNILNKDKKELIPSDYKGDRKIPNGDFIQQIEIAGALMQQGGIYVYRKENYEADDIIHACVQKAKKDFPYLPIDVITGDADMIPLVDEQVSVYMKSKVHTYANEYSPTIKGYVQYTPESYQTYVQELSKYKTSSTQILVPYNTLLLAKILRGDSSDGLKGKPDWKPRMYNQLIEQLIRYEEPIHEIFRYGTWTSEIIDRRTKEVVTDWSSWTPEERKHLFQNYKEPKELKMIEDVLSRHVDDEDIEFIRERYIGMLLNGAFLPNIHVPDEFKRRPYEIEDKKPFTGFDITKLQEAVNVLEIRLPMG
ncbi:potassium transporter TrkH [Bacillus thuringiensis]|nr:potassium transporter TrkH [Bacillus paranthracis]MED3261279.1 potassium transporter TrkH [Bacillus thuringiensis]MED3305509.1 potassium transporter TrkH [Bacillus thuringiensis]MED3341598.1 potassium transporter TrkH [Bacillus thuringiensis]MED3374084.1 potassium transporter TrkH [Bacillus thuringiensis]